MIVYVGCSRCVHGFGFSGRNALLCITCAGWMWLVFSGSNCSHCVCRLIVLGVRTGVLGEKLSTLLVLVGTSGCAHSVVPGWFRQDCLHCLCCVILPGAPSKLHGLGMLTVKLFRADRELNAKGTRAHAHTHTHGRIHRKVLRCRIRVVQPRPFRCFCYPPRHFALCYISTHQWWPPTPSTKFSCIDESINSQPCGTPQPIPADTMGNDTRGGRGWG